MAITNHERVGKALDLLKRGLGPFVQQEFTNAYKDRATIEAIKFIFDDRMNARKPIMEWDVSALLKLMQESWRVVFRQILGQAERTLVSELRGNRNRWAHQELFSFDDTYRLLDSVERLLTAISASHVNEIKTMKDDLWIEKSKSAESVIETKVEGSETMRQQIVEPLVESDQIKECEVVVNKDSKKRYIDTPVQRKQSKAEPLKSHAQGSQWNHNKTDNQDGYINGLLQNNISMKEIVIAFAKRFPDHATPAQRVKRHIDHLKKTHRDFPYELTSDGIFVLKKK